MDLFNKKQKGCWLFRDVLLFTWAFLTLSEILLLLMSISSCAAVACITTPVGSAVCITRPTASLPAAASTPPTATQTSSATPPSPRARSTTRSARCCGSCSDEAQRTEGDSYTNQCPPPTLQTNPPPCVSGLLRAGHFVHGDQHGHYCRSDVWDRLLTGNDVQK